MPKATKPKTTVLYARAKRAAELAEQEQRRAAAQAEVAARRAAEEARLEERREARRIQLQASWDAKVKKDRYDFDIAAGRSHAEAERRSKDWHGAHMGGPGSKMIWRWMEMTVETEKEIDDECEKDDIEWDSEENYGRMVENLGGVPTGEAWYEGKQYGKDSVLGIIERGGQIKEDPWYVTYAKENPGWGRR